MHHSTHVGLDRKLSCNNVHSLGKDTRNSRVTHNYYSITLLCWFFGHVCLLVDRGAHLMVSWGGLVMVEDPLGSCIPPLGTLSCCSSLTEDISLLNHLVQPFGGNYVFCLVDLFTNYSKSYRSFLCSMSYTLVLHPSLLVAHFQAYIRVPTPVVDLLGDVE